MNLKNNKQKIELISEVVQELLDSYNVELDDGKENKQESLLESILSESSGESKTISKTKMSVDEVQDVIKDSIESINSSEYTNLINAGKTKREAVEELTSKRIENNKTKKLIEKAINHGTFTKAKKNKELSYQELTDMEAIVESIKNMGDDKAKDLFDDIIDKIEELIGVDEETPDGEAIEKETNVVKKFLDPSNGVKKMTKVVKENKKIKTTFKKQKSKATKSSELLEKVESMEEKEEYTNYNSINIGQVNLKSPTNFWNGIKLPKNRDAYMLSPVRKEADNFINSTVKEIRKAKNQNISDYTNGLLSAKRIDRKTIYRKDRKIFKRNYTPEKVPAELSVYVALDFSGSTCGGLDKQIASVGIALIEVFEKLKIKHTVMGYDGRISIIKRGVKRTIDKRILASDGISGVGGNNEYSVLKTVASLVQEDKERDILVMIITDGDGSGEERGLKELRNSLTMQHNLSVHSIGLSYDGGSYTFERGEDIYGKGFAHVIKSKKEFAKQIGSIVKKAIWKDEE